MISPQKNCEVYRNRCEIVPLLSRKDTSQRVCDLDEHKHSHANENVSRGTNSRAIAGVTQIDLPLKTTSGLVPSGIRKIKGHILLFDKNDVDIMSVNVSSMHTNNYHANGTGVVARPAGVNFASLCFLLCIQISSSPSSKLRCVFAPLKFFSMWANRAELVNRPFRANSD
jgi:hypothetical protein